MMKKKDGFTEFLNYCCLDDVLIDIKHKQRLTHLEINLKQNIKLPVIIPTIPIKIVQNDDFDINYFDNQKIFEALFKIKDSLSLINNRYLIIEHNDHKNIMFNLYDGLRFIRNKKSKNFDYYYKFFSECFGYTNKNIGFFKIMNYSEFDEPNQYKKHQDILYYIYNNIKKLDVNTFKEILITYDLTTYDECIWILLNEFIDEFT